MSSVAQQRIARESEALELDSEEFEFVSTSGDRDGLSYTTDVEIDLYLNSGSDDAAELDQATDVEDLLEAEASFVTILDDGFFVL